MLLFSLNLTLLRTSMASFCGFWLVVMALWFLGALFGFLSLSLRLPNVVLLDKTLAGSEAKRVND